MPKTEEIRQTEETPTDVSMYPPQLNTDEQYVIDRLAGLLGNGHTRVTKAGLLAHADWCAGGHPGVFDPKAKLEGTLERIRKAIASLEKRGIFMQGTKGIHIENTLKESQKKITKR